MSLRPVKLDVYRVTIPMRGFEHAAARREQAEALVVRLELSDGRAGWGETHPRAYVTGETLDSVITDLRRVVWPALVSGELQAGELPAIPDRDGAGRCIHAAACAVELAAADALLDETDWSKLHQGGTGDKSDADLRRRTLAVRVSGVLGSADPARTMRQLLKMRLFGLRDFKLKVGFSSDVDRANLSALGRWIGRGVAKGKCTLRVDANGGWSAERTPRLTAELKPQGVCAVEQPVFCSAAELVKLAEHASCP